MSFWLVHISVIFQAGLYIPDVQTGTAGWGAGHSRSRQGTRTGWPGHCWRLWCLTGWARAGRGRTLRFLWAVRWQSGDSFLIKGKERPVIMHQQIILNCIAVGLMSYLFTTYLWVMTVPVYIKATGQFRLTTWGTLMSTSNMCLQQQIIFSWIHFFLFFFKLLVGLLLVHRNAH